LQFDCGTTLVHMDFSTFSARGALMARIAAARSGLERELDRALAA
jgi:hypothetical protein